MRLLVTGTQGQVARALIERGAAEGVAIETLGRPAYDLLEPSRIAAAIAAASADVVVNAAAYTAVDKAESEPDIAMRINRDAAGAIAQAAAQARPAGHSAFDGLCLRWNARSPLSRGRPGRRR